MLPEAESPEPEQAKEAPPLSSKEEPDEDPAPDEEVQLDFSVCPECNQELPDEAKFCFGCGHKIGEPKAAEEPVEAPEPTPKAPDPDPEPQSAEEAQLPAKVKVPASAPVKPSKTKPKEEEEEAEGDEDLPLVDFSDIDPKKDWVCFGQRDQDHIDCQQCPFNEDCGEEQAKIQAQA